MYVFPVTAVKSHLLSVSGDVVTECGRIVSCVRRFSVIAGEVQTIVPGTYVSLSQQSRRNCQW